MEMTLDCAVVAASVKDDSHQCKLSYSLSDPFAVQMSVMDTPWTFCRELLTGKTPGLGDVVVDIDPELTSVTLGAKYPDVSVVIILDTMKVQEFILKSYSLCPPGNERYDIDEWIRLCNGEKSL